MPPLAAAEPASAEMCQDKAHIPNAKRGTRPFGNCTRLVIRSPPSLAMGLSGPSNEENVPRSILSVGVTGIRIKRRFSVS
jgi:hypothetical protein